LLSQIQSKPEIEAQEIYRRMRSHAPTSGMSVLIHDVTGAIPPSSLQQDQLLRHQYQQQQQGGALYDQQHEDHHLPRLQQCQQPQVSQQNPHRQHQQQQPQNPNPFFQSGYTGTGVANQLPPLRSVVKVPVSGIDPVQQPALGFQPTAQRQGRKTSQASGMSSGSHSSISSSEAYDQHSLSPQESPSDWAQGPKQ
jgi:hypothetical protein